MSAPSVEGGVQITRLILSAFGNALAKAAAAATRGGAAAADVALFLTDP